MRGWLPYSCTDICYSCLRSIHTWCLMQRSRYAKNPLRLRHGRTLAAIGEPSRVNSVRRVGGLAQRGGGQGFAFGVDDLGALLPFGFGLAGHGAFHGVGQLDVLEFDQGDLDAPVDGGDVEDLADVQVDLVGLGQGLVQGVLADDLAQGGLGDLVDGGVDVLDSDDGFDGVDDAEVGDGGDVDADVVAGDDALRLDGHGDDPQRHPVQHVGERDDEPEAGVAGAADPAQPEQHALLVLLDDPRGQGRAEQQQHDDDDDDDDQGFHGDPSDVSKRPVIFAGEYPGRRLLITKNPGPACSREFYAGAAAGVRSNIFHITTLSPDSRIFEFP